MSRCILVVEDQMDNRQILRDLLGNAGYELLEAENGAEALTTVARQRPDLILMDIQLPVMDGYEATRRLKADPATKSIPIIVVTSYALSGDETKAREAGCDAYVTKPFSPRQLLGKVREFLP
jgi:two-component system, cell cycle response regulator DivK